MHFKRTLVGLLAFMLLVVPFLNAVAEAQYYTDVRVNAVALDQPTPSPVPTPTPSPTPQPTPTPEPVDYEIEVDLENQIVTVYREDGRTQDDIARQMICSSGTGTNTPTGTFIMPEVQKVDEREEWYYIGKYRLHVQYASRIVDAILFHSLPSEQRGATPTQDSIEALGSRASHGCIRLRPADSRWIAENCPPGTQVTIFEGGTPNEALRRRLMITSFASEEMSYGDFLAGEKVYSLTSHTDEVRYMQVKLAELGFLLNESDGFFGAETHFAVVEWQLENGYDPTGEVSEEQLSVLLRQTPVPGAAASRGKSAIVQTKDGLILRSEPNAKSKKLDVLRDGTAVRVLEEVRGWYKLRIGSQTGYAAAKYIKITENNPEVN